MWVSKKPMAGKGGTKPELGVKKRKEKRPQMVKQPGGKKRVAQGENWTKPEKTKRYSQYIEHAMKPLSQKKDFSGTKTYKDRKGRGGSGEGETILLTDGQKRGDPIPYFPRQRGR